MSLNPDLWHWPQWVVIVVLLLGPLAGLTHHGKPKVDQHGEPFTYNGMASALVFFGWYYLLCQGGFFR